MSSFLKLFTAVGMLCLLATCGNDSGLGEGLEWVERTDAYNNLERYSRRTADYAKEGDLMRISPDGNVIELAEYQNDTLNGKRIMFAENGDTLIIENYKKGLFYGEYRAYYDENQLELIGEYTANSMAC